MTASPRPSSAGPPSSSTASSWPATRSCVDAGCGSGKITLELIAPRSRAARVYAVDAAPSMVRHTQEAVGDRATALCQDLAELSLPEPVDVVFSNATFHWIPDHDALFAALARNMKPGARLLAQCGGKGNIDRFRVLADKVALEEEPFAPYFADWVRPWNYATAEETAERLERAGFRRSPPGWRTSPRRSTTPRPFVSTVCLVRHLDPLPPSCATGSSTRC